MAQVFQVFQSSISISFFSHLLFILVTESTLSCSTMLYLLLYCVRLKNLLFLFLSYHISFSIPHCVLTFILVILEFMKFFVHFLHFILLSLFFFTFYENIHWRSSWYKKHRTSPVFRSVSRQIHGFESHESRSGGTQRCAPRQSTSSKSFFFFSQSFQQCFPWTCLSFLRHGSIALSARKWSFLFHFCPHLLSRLNKLEKQKAYTAWFFPHRLLYRRSTLPLTWSPNIGELR